MYLIIWLFYAYNYIENEIIWAKKFDAPFRSNLKVDGKKIISCR